MYFEGDAIQLTLQKAIANLPQKQQLVFKIKYLVTRLRTFLPPQKIIKLKKAEDNFKRMLLQRLKQRKGN